MMMKCKFNKYIDSYMDKIRSGKILASKELKQAMDLVERKLSDPDVIIKHEMIDKAIELTERYFDMKLLDWELFLFALIHCYYKSTDMVVFDEFLIVMGRGNGKNGFISPVAWYLSTHYHGIKGYNVDIIANSEDQAMTSFNDIFEVLENTWKKSKKFFTKTKQQITNKKTKSYIKFNTSNAKTKDGKRSACLIFDEIHEYENYDTIKVFTSGFGKRKHSRVFYITTNGYVRGGVLDEQLKIAHDVLDGKIKDLGLLPLIYKIDSKEEVDNTDNWVKACPSLPYFPNLKKEMDKEFVKMKYQNHVALDFMTKRMNLPAQDAFTAAVPWEKILATNRPIPYESLQGMQCLGAIDYAMVTDFASCGLLFKYNGLRYWIEHTFVCHKALEVTSRPIKFPVQEMVEKGLITIVYGDSITPEIIENWFLEQQKKYNILDIFADDYRIQLLKAKFDEVGLPLHKVRSGPITHAKVAPLIESIFAEEQIVFGDNPTMRWYINNTYQEPDKKGNISYYKIEPKTRKTDGFFALIHALSKDEELKEQTSFMRLNVQTY
ncbi:terminase large subunit [Clostridium botulinum C/D]|nr:terminase large subunit [Clostridium botulinum C/D]MCD3259824.1 terminase large subunit [Clostridium botulinum C/D]MCD3264980.1 terminase large subunit [Clostridium botulinum C/D]